jgi:UDP-N-acetylmuramate--alanine ligase
MEVRYDQSGITVLDDYGHHPTAIDATISTVRLRYPGRPLILAIEPLTYHRTAALLPALARSCAAADRVAVADIFAVRDTDLTITSAAKLAAAISALGTQADAPGSVEAAADTIFAALPAEAVILVMGGGRSTDLATRLAAALAAR